NAIHGFACRKPWRVVKDGADNRSAWVTGVFHGSVDAPEARDQWPADYRLQVTYQLGPHQLNVEAVVINTDSRPLPFGLGYHPPSPRTAAARGGGQDSAGRARGGGCGEPQAPLPRAPRPPVDAPRDLRQPRRYLELELDDVLTDLQGPLAAGGGLRRCGGVTV